MTTRVFLVRHGQTDGNVEGRSQGRRDVPLNATGRAQAERVARVLAGEALTAIACSPSGRARDTALAVARVHSMAPLVDPRLAELDQGEMDGLTPAEMRERFPQVLQRWSSGDPSDVRIPGGETMAEAQARMVEAIEALAAAHADGLVAVVSHNLALKAALCHALGVPLAAFRALQTDVASISVVDVRPGAAWTVLGVNDRCHLE